MSDLGKLIEAVEAGNIPHSMVGLKSLDRLTSAALPQDVRALNILAWQAYIGRLDPAKALHEALLPGWEWGRLVSHGTMVVATKTGRYQSYSAEADIPARAWLLAILRAYAIQQEPTP